MGAIAVIMKCSRGNGTRFVWNSVRSTLSAPSKRSDAVTDEMHCASSRFRFVYVGRSMPRLRRQMSYSASLSTMNATSECSIIACAHSTELYGSTTAVAICGDGYTANSILLFLP